MVCSMDDYEIIIKLKAIESINFLTLKCYYNCLTIDNCIFFIALIKKTCIEKKIIILTFLMFYFSKMIYIKKILNL